MMLGRIVKTRDGELHIAFRDKVIVIHHDYQEWIRKRREYA